MIYPYQKIYYILSRQLILTAAFLTRKPLINKAGFIECVFSIGIIYYSLDKISINCLFNVISKNERGVYSLKRLAQNSDVLMSSKTSGHQSPEVHTKIDESLTMLKYN